MVYDILKFLHTLSFVFMSVPLFNLIIVNERALLGGSFIYNVDRYMENIIKKGAIRCFVFQSTAFVTGLLLLFFCPLGIGAIWQNWIIIAKILLLFSLTGLLSYVHFYLQKRIERLFADLASKDEGNIMEGLKPYRIQRKRLAALCLFLVLTTIILGLQVYALFNPLVTALLIASAGLFALRANKTLLVLGWY